MMVELSYLLTNRTLSIFAKTRMMKGIVALPDSWMLSPVIWKRAEMFNMNYLRRVLERVSVVGSGIEM